MLTDNTGLLALVFKAREILRAILANYNQVCLIF